ncbi:MAG: hypothetical protein HZB73_00665 [Nitrosarchaeum sp.]|nr:hypothetical protein [Nitrosarchaeum sp.]
MQISQELQDDANMLETLGLTKNESKAYLSLISSGVADARTICQESGVPSSKIYGILEKFKLLGLIESQNTKPAKFRVIEPSQGLQKLLRNKEKEVMKIKEDLPFMENHLNSIYSEYKKDEKAFFNMEFGMKKFIQNHVSKLSETKTENCSYLETNCIKGLKVYGSEVKNKIAHHIIKNDIKSRFILGTTNKNLIKYFLDIVESTEIQIRITKQLHSPFHVLDNESTITVVDNPLADKGQIASIYTINNELTKTLKEGFEDLWKSAIDAKQYINKNKKQTKRIIQRYSYERKSHHSG